MKSSVKSLFLGFIFHSLLNAMLIFFKKKTATKVEEKEGDCLHFQKSGMFSKKNPAYGVDLVWRHFTHRISRHALTQFDGKSWRKLPHFFEAASPGYYASVGQTVLLLTGTLCGWRKVNHFIPSRQRKFRLNTVASIKKRSKKRFLKF